MRNILRLTACIAAVLAIAGFAAPMLVSAQTPEPVADPFATFSSLSGLESGAVRVFSSDATGEDAAATPDATALASPVAGDGLAGASRVTVAVLQFDADASAISAMSKIQNELQGETAVTAFVPGALGDKTSAFIPEDETGTPTGSTIVVQTGNEVVIVVTEAAGADTEDATTALATAILESESVTGEPQFAPDGTSTGGQWDRLPTTDDPALTTLPTVEDIDLLQA